MVSNPHSNRLDKILSNPLVPAVAFGWCIGCLLGATATCGIFWLDDLSHTPRDLFILSLFSNVVFGLAGFALGVLLAAAKACWPTHSQNTANEKMVVRGQANFLLEGLALVLAIGVKQ